MSNIANNKAIRLEDGSARDAPTAMFSTRAARRTLTSVGLLGCGAVLLVVLIYSTPQGGKSLTLVPEPQHRAAAYGSCPAKPSTETLRWNANAATADHICCNNHDYAEYFGYWLTTSFPMESSEPITFYDPTTARPLFVAPKGRSYADFIAESQHHGWPSFRDAELVKENVVVLRGGETVSINGTHLGHNLPDAQGNRYCINIVCIAGNPKSG